ncbi:MAG: hypothetical protein HOO92_07655 [Methylococcaceae bacterium]|nr:hypothetical protein [Methylococcaceae bacterium]
MSKLDALLNVGKVPTYLLAAVPDLARQVRINKALKQGLISLPLDDRVRCANILDHIGDPTGVEHLVYNALVNHPKLNYRQLESKGWPGTVFRVADKLTALQVNLLIDDMVEYQVFHGRTLAFVNPEWVVPNMLKLLKHANPVLQHFAAYVLAFHGYADGVEQLKNWANSSPFPYSPLEAMLQLPGNEWTAYLHSFIAPEHPIYQNERYQGYALKEIFPMITQQLTIKKKSSTAEQLAYIYELYGRTLSEVEVYTGCADGTRAMRQVEPPVMVIKKSTYPSLYFAQELFLALKHHELQQHLAGQQRLAVKQLFERAGLVFENLLDAAVFNDFISGMNPMRSLHRTGFLDRDSNLFLNIPIKIYYDTDDYLNSATDWIVNPLKHRSPAFTMKYL